MNLEEYRTLFLMVTLGLTLVVAYPALVAVIPFQGGSEQFTELWLLGPDHSAENYPFNVSAGETYKIFVDVANHMDRSEYYLIQVKFRNMTQFIVEGAGSKPSSVHPLYEFRFIVNDENLWESSVNFGFQNGSIENKVLDVDNVTMNASIEDAVLFVDEVIINGMVIPVDAYTSWDSENSGFYFCLSFELWRYDTVLKSFRFHDRIVGLRLNMTDY